MRPGRSPTFLSTLHSWLFRLVAISLFFSFSFITSASAQTAPKTSHVNLFSLPLEDVLNISINAEEWHENFDDGIWIANPEVIRNAIAKESLRLTQFASNNSSFSNNLNFSKGEAILAIDGWTVGPIESEKDLFAYLEFYKDRIKHIELLRGESAFWWSNGDSHVVINIITTIRHSELLDDAHDASEEVTP